MDSAEVWLCPVALNPCYRDLAKTASFSEHLLSQELLLSQFLEPVSYVHHCRYCSFSLLI